VQALRGLSLQVVDAQHGRAPGSSVPVT